MAFRKFDEPLEVEERKVVVRPEVLGPRFKKDAGKVKAALEDMDPQYLSGRDSVTVDVDGQMFEVEKDAFEIQLVKEKKSGERYVPSVIEPSYGIDRIFYSVLEHAYTVGEEDYVTLRLKPEIAPVKTGIFPLMAKSELEEKAKAIDRELRGKGIVTYYDDGGSIGRRYARMDEVGTPFCITVDYETLDDDSVTIRDRDTKEQVRVRVREVAVVLGKLVRGDVDLTEFAK
jgi:glycyl-tRNA synthetase